MRSESTPSDEHPEESPAERLDEHGGHAESYSMIRPAVPRHWLRWAIPSLYLAKGLCGLCIEPRSPDPWFDLLLSLAYLIH